MGVCTLWTETSFVLSLRMKIFPEGIQDAMLSVLFDYLAFEEMQMR